MLKDEDVAPQLLYIALYVLLLAISMTLCLGFGVGWQNSLAASITSISNVASANVAKMCIGRIAVMDTTPKCLKM